MVTGIHDNHNIMKNAFHERVQITNKVQRRECIPQIGGVQEGDTVGSVVCWNQLLWSLRTDSEIFRSFVTQLNTGWLA